MTHPGLRPLWLLCAAALLSCTNAPEKRDAPIPRPFDQGLAVLIEQIPAAMPVLVTLRVDRKAGLDAAFEEILGQILPPDVQDPLRIAIFELVGDLDATKAPKLAGLDKNRALVAGFMAPPPGHHNQYESIVYGNIPDTTEVPRAMHGRIMLPATDARVLTASLAEWARSQGAAILPMGGEIAGLGVGATAMTLGKKVFAIIPRTNAVQLDIIEGTFLVDDATAALGACLTSRGSPRAMTPAMVHLLEGEGAINIHLDMEGLTRTAALSGTIEIASALSHASTEMIVTLWAAGAAIVLNTATLMNAFDRNVRDVTLSVSADKGIETRITRSLTRTAQSAHEIARPQRGRIYHSTAKAPLLVAQLGASPRALGTARGPMTWTKGTPISVDEFSRVLNEGGIYMSLYALLNTPTLLTGSLHEHNAPVVDIFPDSLTLVVGDLSISNEGKPRIILALIAEYPKGPLNPTLSKLLSTLEDNLGEELPDHAFHKDVRQTAERTTLRLGIGVQPEALIDMDRPIVPEVDLRVTLDIGLMDKIFGDQTMPAYMNVLKPGGRFEVVDETRGDCQATRARYITKNAMGQKPPSPLRAILTPSIKPIPDKGQTEGHRCLVRVSGAIAETFQILAHASPQMRDRLIEQATKGFAEDLACARQHPETATMADEVESGWHLFFARYFAFNRMNESARRRATAACELGRAPACELAASLAPAWPEDSLDLPRISWPQLERPLNVEHTLSVTNEGIYIDKTRISDLDKLAEAGEGPLPWLVEALSKNKGAGQARETAIELNLDTGLKGQQVRRLMRSARGAGFSHAWLMLGGDEGHSGAEHVLLGGEQVKGGFWPFYGDRPTTGDAYVKLGDGHVELLRTGLPTTVIKLDDKKAPLLIAGWVAEQGRGLGHPAIYHVEDTANRPWNDTLTLLAPLKVGWQEAPASLDEAGRLISEWVARRPVVFIFDSPQPEASKAGITAVIGGDPVIGPALTREEIKAGIARLVPKVKHCYEKSLMEGPALSAKLVVSFAIQSDGSTKGVKAVQNTGDKAMESCILGVFQKARFAKPRGGGIVNVTYPFVFNVAQ